MRVTIDIPNVLYRHLKAKAAGEKCSVEELIVRSIEAGLRVRKTKKGLPVTLPLIRSKRPGSLVIDNEKIYQIIPFP